MTPVERRRFVHGRARATHGGYPERVRALAASESVTLVDLTTNSRELWQQLGEEASKSAFLWLSPGLWPEFADGEQDDTHFSAHGADLVARLVSDGLRDAGLLPSPAPTPILA